MFAGCGAIVTDAERDGALGVVGIGLVFFLVLLAIIAALGHISGAHFNPGVSLGFFLTRHLPPRDLAAYWAAQFAGAILAALLLLVVWPGHPADLGATVPSVSVGRALLIEVVLTALLMLVIMSVATDTRAVGAPAALAIAAAVGLASIAFGPLTGASLNTARSFGPALASGQWQDFWIYVAGPLAGAPLGAADTTSSSGERRPMATALFVCLHNAGRSQMSQALFERAAGGRHRGLSAGSEADPGGRVHPEVVEVMAELGVDVAGRRPQRLSDDLARRADVIVTMGCGDACPFIPGKRYLDWDLPDPKGRPVAEVRATRDDIARRVEALVAELDAA